MSGIDDFLDEQIAETKTLIKEMQKAMTDLQTGQINSYTVDTGQTKTTVTNQNLSTLTLALDRAYLRLEIIENRRTGEGSFSMSPGF